jgi:PAS domain S-box-containing protein
MNQDNTQDPRESWAQPEVRSIESGLGGIRAHLSHKELTQWLEHLIQATPDIVVVYDVIENSCVYVNDRISYHLGYSQEEVHEWCGELLQQIVHPLEQSTAQAFYKTFESAGADEVRTMIYRVRHKDGDYRWFDHSAVVFQRTESGQVQQVLFVARDVTQRKQTEQALRELEERRSLAMNAAGIGEWMLDPMTDELYWSDSVRDLLGVDREKPATSETALSVIHPDDRARVLQALETAITSSVVFHTEFRLLDPNGKLVWVDARGQLMLVDTPEDQQVPKLVGVLQDITPRKEAEQMLREWNTKLRFLSEMALNLLAAEDEQEISEIFGQVCERFGYDICFNFMAADQGDDLYLVSGYGLPESVAKRLQHLPYSQTICCITDKPHCHIDVDGFAQIDSVMTQVLKEMGIRTYACYPIRRDDRLLGTLSFGSRDQHAFVESDLTFLQTLSHYIIMARERVQAVKAMQDARNWLQERVDARTAELQHSNERLLQEIEERTEMEVTLAEVRRHLDQSREKERLRLARELHDGPMQDLSIVLYQLSVLAEEHPDEHLSTVLAVTAAQIEKVNGKLRAFARNLRPPVLASFGILAAIEDHVARFQRQFEPIKVILDLPHQDEIKEEIQSLTLFRIFEQALFNVAQHAQATAVRVSLQYATEQIVLEIEDNGQGFEVPKHWVVLVRDGHLGLAGMVERAEDIGGHLEVTSQIGHGTLVRVQIPRPAAG